MEGNDEELEVGETGPARMPDGSQAVMSPDAWWCVQLNSVDSFSIKLWPTE